MFYPWLASRKGLQDRLHELKFDHRGLSLTLTTLDQGPVGPAKIGVSLVSDAGLHFGKPGKDSWNGP